jgi:hypothetical protein
VNMIAFVSFCFLSYISITPLDFDRERRAKCPARPVCYEGWFVLTLCYGTQTLSELKSET